MSESKGKLTEINRNAYLKTEAEIFETSVGNMETAVAIIKDKEQVKERVNLAEKMLSIEVNEFLRYFVEYLEFMKETRLNGDFTKLEKAVEDASKTDILVASDLINYTSVLKFLKEVIVDKKPKSKAEYIMFVIENKDTIKRVAQLIREKHITKKQRTRPLNAF